MTSATLWIKFLIGCFGSKGHLWPADTLNVVVGTWVVSVLADDPYTYLNAQNIHYAFFTLFNAVNMTYYLIP